MNWVFDEYHAAPFYIQKRFARIGRSVVHFRKICFLLPLTTYRFCICCTFACTIRLQYHLMFSHAKYGMWTFPIRYINMNFCISQNVKVKRIFMPLKMILFRSIRCTISIYSRLKQIKLTVPNTQLNIFIAANLFGQ